MKASLHELRPDCLNLSNPLRQPAPAVPQLEAAVPVNLNNDMPSLARRRAVRQFLDLG